MKKKRSKCPPEGPKGVGKSSLTSGWGREALPKVLEGSGVRPGGPDGVGRPSRKSWRPCRKFGRGQEDLSLAQMWS